MGSQWLEGGRASGTAVRLTVVIKMVNSTWLQKKTELNVTVIRLIDTPELSK